jgi:hypothetical protein
MGRSEGIHSLGSRGGGVESLPVAHPSIRLVDVGVGALGDMERLAAMIAQNRGDVVGNLDRVGHPDFALAPFFFT